MEKLKVKILDKRWGEEWPLPQYATVGSAGIDLRACIEEKVIIPAGKKELIPSGLAIHIGDINYAAFLLPRSGMAHKRGLILGNTIGLIDSDYQGELVISCWNASKKSIEINSGERIAQLVILPVLQVKVDLVEEFTASERGEGGFGHTGDT